MVFDKFLDPLGENIDVKETGLSDIIVDFSDENTSDQHSEDDQDEYILRPPVDMLSRVEIFEICTSTSIFLAPEKYY